MSILDQIQNLQFGPQGVLNTVFNQDPTQQPSFVGLNPRMPQNTPMLSAMGGQVQPQAPQAPQAPSFGQQLSSLGDSLLAFGARDRAGAFANLDDRKIAAQRMSLEMLKASRPTLTQTGQPGIMLATFPDGSQRTIVVDEAVRAYQDQQDRIDRREQNRLDAQDRRLTQQIDAADRRAQAQIDAADRRNQQKSNNKVLPAGLQKVENEYEDAIQAHVSNVNNIRPIIDNLTRSPETGQAPLELGPLRNAFNASRNLFGRSTPESLRYQELQEAKTRFVNESLRLNKGVQTEGDAQRAAKELEAAWAKNDTEATRKAFERLEAVNIRAANNKATLINKQRSSQGVDPLYSGPVITPRTTATPGQDGVMTINGVTVQKVN